MLNGLGDAVTAAHEKTEDAARSADVFARAFEAAPSPVDARALLDEIAASDGTARPLHPTQPLALYGAGDLGRLARDHLRYLEIPIAAVIDRNAAAIASDPGWTGIPIMHPDKVDPTFKREAMLAVSIATSPFAPLQASLRAASWNDVVPYYDIAESFRDRHPLSNGWIADPFSSADVSALGDVLDGWADHLSRAHHLQFLAWRRLRQEWTFGDAPVMLGDRFFIPEILSVLRNDEHYVDAGAHFGHVARRFIEEREGQFTAVTAIEPDAQSLGVLRQTIAALPAQWAAKVAALDAVLDFSPQRRAFHAGLGYASQIASTGKATRKTTTIDALALNPTILKLHLEGHELPALKGAATTLASCRPIVTATVYHNADGLYATARWMMQTLDNYRFLFRLHSWCGTGAVIYAIPAEREIQP
ncbi:FkbM family methyltransferase [Rhizobium sp. C4]|uniref:FkbM family methyltransferase n=1 Tax=Rhizobium sp. C4 TaxID=1349800 RepID=UPI001E3A5CC3|nr:FkbM family methyltransferase [Rhizobium sp. C4]MCD2173839.1 FkbM family methyltransferase [Rhizobium sp. C4]